VKKEERTADNKGDVQNNASRDAKINNKKKKKIITGMNEHSLAKRDTIKTD
jgi:hypothetical protein